MPRLQVSLVSEGRCYSQQHQRNWNMRPRQRISQMLFLFKRILCSSHLISLIWFWIVDNEYGIRMKLIYIFYGNYKVVSSLSDLISCVLLPHISINICSTVPWYILFNREFCNLYIDTVNFFQNWIFCLFSAYYHMISLSNFQSIFSTNSNWTKALPKKPEKLIRHLAMIVLMSALFDVGLRNFVPEILTSKISPEVVDLQ